MAKKNLLQILGVSKAKAKIAKKKASYELGLYNGISMATNYLLRESLILCPLDTGNLKRSGKAEVKRVPVIQGTVFYTAEYSVYVHEMVGANFQTPGTQAKFLEEPARTARPRMVQIIREQLDITKRII